jgi:hypothetical protein
MSEPLGALPPAPPPMPPAAPAGRASTRAIVALVLGICGLSGCGAILAPFAWYLGAVERKAIAAGLAPAEGATIAQVGMILGMIGTALLAFGLIWILFMGGMIFLQALVNH